MNNPTNTSTQSSTRSAMVADGLNRRRFLNNSMIAVGGAWVLGRPASDAQAQASAPDQMPAKPDAVSLEQSFASPPASAQCFTHWYWHVPANKENITQDLEAMRQQGIKGARVFPFGAYMTPEWLPLFGHMLEEAKRLNLQIQLNNDRGWSCKFLPWMTDELAAKKVVYSENTVEGGRRIMTPLAVPEINDDYYKTAVVKLNGRAAVKRSEVNQYYRDIAVVACRVPPGRPRAGPSPGPVPPPAPRPAGA